MEVVYTVTAYRWGDNEQHSYIVGVYETHTTALAAADKEEEDRAGKYECEVLKINISKDDDNHQTRQLIKALENNDIKSVYKRYSRVVHQRLAFGPRDDRPYKNVRKYP